MYSASCTRPMALGRSMWFFGRKRSHRVVGRHWFWTFHPRRWCRTMKPTPKGALMHRGRAQTLAFRRTRRHRLSISVSMFRRCGNRNTKAAVGGHTWRQFAANRLEKFSTSAERPLNLLRAAQMFNRHQNAYCASVLVAHEWLSSLVYKYTNNNSLQSNYKEKGIQFQVVLQNNDQDIIILTCQDISIH